MAMIQDSDIVYHERTMTVKGSKIRLDPPGVVKSQANLDLAMTAV